MLRKIKVKSKKLDTLVEEIIILENQVNPILSIKIKRIKSTKSLTTFHNFVKCISQIIKCHLNLVMNFQLLLTNMHANSNFKVSFKL